MKADKDYSVEVLGTSFNVSAYKDESMIRDHLGRGIGKAERRVRRKANDTDVEAKRESRVSKGRWQDQGVRREYRI